MTLPVIGRRSAAGALLVALYTLSDFGVVSLMRYDVLTRAVFLQYRSLFDRTPAAVLAARARGAHGVVLCARGARARACPIASPGGGGSRPAAGGARALAPPGLPRARSRCPSRLLVPVAVLVYWAARGVELDVVSDRMGRGRQLAAGLHPGGGARRSPPRSRWRRWLVRYRRGWTRALERASYAPNALPGIVIALSLVFFAASYASPVYQTLALLVFAYVVRFFPQALAGATAPCSRWAPGSRRRRAGWSRPRRRSWG